MTNWLYRGRQFWRSLTAKPARKGMAEARLILSPSLYGLFTRLQPSEKAHAIEVLHSVREQSEDADLLAAALLHDIGKIIQPLKTWERALIVLARPARVHGVIDPLVDETTPEKPQGWARALVVAEKHPAWGAQLARKAGASQTLVQLIRRHQDPLPAEPVSRIDALLALLQEADDRS